MVRDERGQKMSKTKCNVIDPLDLTATHGADALRFTLAALATQGHDLNFAPARLEGYRAFANKIWNATRFVFMNIDDGQTFGPLTPAECTDLSVADRWILHTLDVGIQTATEALERFEFQLAANTIYQFFWSGLCDWYIEFSKSALREGGAEKARTQRVLVHCLDQALRLLHPYMPYITEDLWMRLPLAERDAPSLCVAPWPVSDPAWRDEAASSQAQIEIDMITGLRAIRGENKIAAADKPSVYIQTANTQLIAAIQASQNNIQFMTGTTIAGLGAAVPALGPSAVASGPDYKIFLPLPEHIVASEVTRLEKAVAKLDKDIEKFEAKLANPTFVANAPPEVVAEQRQRLAEAGATRATYVEQVARLRA
jgi:valyl-tRNA synthetase